MIKVKDGYAKLIGTTYLGSADRVLLSNGGDIEKAVASTANTLVLRNSSGLIESTLATGTAPFKITSTTLVNNLNSNYLEGLKRRYRIQLDNVTATGPYCKLMTIKTNGVYIDLPITFKYSLRTSGSGSTHEGYVTIKILGKPVSISVTGDSYHNDMFYLYTISEEVITGNTTTYIGTHELYFKGDSWTSGDFWDIHWGSVTNSIVCHENQKTGLQEPTNYIRVLQSTTGRIGGSVRKVIVTLNNKENAYYPLIWASPENETTSDSELFKSYSDLTYNPSNKRITAGEYRGTANGAVLYWGDKSEFHLGKNNTTDFYFWSNSTTARLRLGTNGSERLTILANGNVGISNINPSYKLDVNGHTRIYGNLLIGANTTRNYIAFHGTTGDGDGAFNHTYIGENIYYGAESSELVLFKGNDLASNAANPNGTGPDRIRYIAAGHLFQIYKSPVSGTFESVCTSTTPVNTLAINANDVTSYLNVLPSANNTLNLGSSSFKWANIYSTKFIGALLGNADTATNATNADTVDNYHMTIEGHYLVSKSITDTTNATWYVRIELDLSWNGRGHRIICLPSYNNVNGVFILEIPSHSQDEGYIAKVSSYNKCNIKAFCIVKESLKICVYLLLVGYTGAYCAVSSTCNIDSLTVVSAPSYNFINVNHKSITTNYEYRINKLAIKHDYPSPLGVCIGNRNTNPTLGNLSDSQTAVIGEREYGTTFWTRGDGNGYIQQGRFDGKATAYNLILQALGGNVGINTESPGYKLHVNGTGAFNLSLHLMEGAELHLKAAANSTDPGDIVFKDGNNTEIGRIYKSSAENNFYVRFSSSDSGKVVLHSGNSSVSDYAVKINNTTKNFVRDWGSGAADMNAVARGGRSSMGMANLIIPEGTATAVNPNGLTGWHHFINMSFDDGGGGSNAWITQIANKAGSTDLWVRSRYGGTIDNTVAWVAGWTRILTGSNYTSVLDGNYVKAYKTLTNTYNIDDDWGLSVVTFDPKALGTYPSSGNLANFTLLNLGNTFNRRKQFGFDWYTDSIFYRRHVDSAWKPWVTLLHDGNEKVFIYRGILTDTNDLNSITKTGTYYTLKALNLPTSFANWYGNAINFTFDTTNYQWQLWAADTYNNTSLLFRKKQSSNWSDWWKIWHDGNDGSGSGLDADLLDGLHLNSIYTLATADDFGTTSKVPSGFLTHYTIGTDYTNSPLSLIQGNLFTVINHLRTSSKYGAQLAFGFGSDYLAIRRRGDSTTWGAWSKIKAGSADNADTLDGIHANGLLTALSSNITNKVSITVGGTTKNITTLYASYLCSVGVVNPLTGRTLAYGNVYSYNTNLNYHEGAPTTYTSVIGFGRGAAGGVEICGEWTSGRGLWVRALRDTTDDWYAWDRILTEATYKTVLDSRYYTETEVNNKLAGYLPLAGGTMSSGTAQIQRAGSSTLWYLGRTNAMIRINSYSGYNAIASMKTTNGDWSLGVHSNNVLYFTYITDTNFNASTNTTTALVYINASGSMYATHFYEHSDINLKTNIKPIVTSDNIPLLKSFDWKSDGSHSYGLIAQELEEQGYSELVSDEGGLKTVKYSAALSLIVGKLQVKIKELEKEIENLKNKN